MDILSNLSFEQKEAAKEILAPVCILAGAGSGKTRVITHRIAYLVKEHGVRPYNILGVTFTNKAAKEMKERVEKLLPYEGHLVLLGTFHGLSARFLRWQGHLVGLPNDFLIYDEDDVEKLIKKIIKERFSLDKEEAKIELARALRAREEAKNLSKTTAIILKDYYKEMEKIGAVDFNSLLKKFLELLENEEGFSYISNKVQHLLVDEFQDINETQSKIVNLLAKNAKTCAIVGDDDQSIYGWRGASAQFMHRFLEDFSSSKLYRLEENYRSTSPILACANEIISHNKTRLGKNLRSVLGDGPKVSLKRYFKDNQEAKAVVEEAIRQFGALGKSADIAVLMRTNAQSRVFEEALHRARLPYRIIGGMRFYDRKEIKDVLSSLKCILYEKSDLDILRLLSSMPFGIGAQTQNKISMLAKEQNLSFFEGMEQFLSNKKIEKFYYTIKNLREEQKNIQRADDALINVINGFGFVKYYESIGDEDALSRLENIEELIKACTNFVEDASSNGEPIDAKAFLENVALVSKDESEEGEGFGMGSIITMMTLHSAKGLEFDCVFLVGLEEGILPHQRALEGYDERRLKESLEEERRLMYVGVTRAKKRLFLSYCMERFHYGKTVISLPSRFIKEIPKESVAKEDQFLLLNR